MRHKSQLRQGFVFEELEPRILLSADWGALLTAGATPDDGALVQQISAPVASAAATSSAAPASASITQRKELVVIDPRIAGYDTLVHDLLSSAGNSLDILLLDPNSDGIAQLNDALASRHDLDAVHIFSHGADGVIELGSTRLDMDGMRANAGAIQGWSSALNSDADLMIYGCDVAGTEAGLSFLNAMARLTGADVAASDDATGLAALGGDWELEFQSGVIETAVAPSAMLRTSWSVLLDGAAVWSQSAGTTPQTANFTGSFGATTATTNVSGTLAVMQAADAPTRDEAIVVGVDTGGTIRGEIRTGATWTALPFTMGTASDAAHWSVAVSYESQSGDALVVWDNGTTGFASLSYRVWDGTAWSAEQTITTPDSGEAQNFRIASSPLSDEMTLVASNDSSQKFALIWDGTSWGNGRSLGSESFPSGASTDVSVAYEAISGTALVVYQSVDFFFFDSLNYQTWNGSGWSAEGSITAPGFVGSQMEFATLAADPTSDRLALGVLTPSNDVWFGIWDGSAWGDTIVATNASENTNTLNMNLAFESQSGDLLAVYGESATTPRFRTFTAGTWSAEQSAPDIGANPKSMTLVADANSNEVMFAVQDAASDLHFINWDGASFGTDTELETNAPAGALQPFAFVDVVNVAPVITSDGGGANAAINVAENGTAVTTVTSTDPDGGAPTYFVAAGTDQARFTIDAVTGVLSFTVAPDFEAPSDSNLDNVYEVIVVVNDGKGAFDAQTILVTVTNVSDIPIGAISDSNAAPDTVNENSLAGTTVGITALATDPDVMDTISYTLDDDAGGLFAIDPVTGVVTVAGLINRELAASHNITVRATSSDTSFSTQVFTIAVNDANEFNVSPVTDADPVADAVSENAANGTVVAITAQATDADATNNTVTYTLDDTAGGRFTIDPLTGVVTVADGTLLDFETSAAHNITVRATSSDTSVSTQVFTISVTPLNDNSPVVTSDGGGPNAALNVAENGTAVTTVTATDADLPAQTLSYTIIGGADQGLFTIDSVNGALTFNAAPDFETPGDTGGNNIFDVIIQISDGTLTDTQTLAITVTNVNEAPSSANVTLNILEDMPYTFVSGDFAFTDPDAGDTLGGVRIESLPAAGTLTLNGVPVTAAQVIAPADIAAGLLVFTPDPNTSGNPYTTFNFRVSDNTGLFETGLRTAQFNVGAANDAPVANDDSFVIAEDGVLNVPATGVLGNDTDLDGDPLGVSSHGAASNGTVAVNPDGSFTYTPNPDFNGGDSFSYTITDGSGGFATATVTLTITAVNDAPTLVINNGTATASSGTSVIGNTSLATSDVDNSAVQLVYTLSSAPMNGVMLLNGVALTAGGTFTQDDIDAGRVEYQHQTAGSTSDSFVFTVTDGAGGNIPATNFAISIAPPPVPAPTVTTPPPASPPVAPPPAPAAPLIPAPNPAPLDDSPVFTGSRSVPPAGPGAPVSPVRVEKVSNIEQAATPAIEHNATPEVTTVRAIAETLHGSRRDLEIRDLEAPGTHVYAALAATTGISLSAGFVAWLLRGGAMASSLLASAPLWRSCDPLPILARRRRSEPDYATGLDTRRLNRQERAVRDMLRGDQAEPRA